MLYVLYTDALVFNNKFDKHTRDELNKVLHAVQTTKLRKSADFSFIILKARSHLALVLQQMGSDEQEQKEWACLCFLFNTVLYVYGICCPPGMSNIAQSSSVKIPSWSQNAPYCNFCSDGTSPFIPCSNSLAGYLG